MKDITKWLYTNINHIDDTKNIELINQLYDRLLLWIESKEDLTITIDESSFKILFYNLIYTKYS